jgi:hypothetical protein
MALRTRLNSTRLKLLRPAGRLHLTAIELPDVAETQSRVLAHLLNYRDHVANRFVSEHTFTHHVDFDIGTLRSNGFPG